MRADNDDMRRQEQRDAAERDDRVVGTNTEGARTTNVGFPNPSSPQELMGFDPLPTTGGVGANDPAAGADVAGDDQGHDMDIASNEDTPTPLRVDKRGGTTGQGGSGGSSSSW